MIDLGDELAGYGEPFNDGGLVPDDGYIPNGGHRRLADLQKTGFNVPPGVPDDFTRTTQPALSPPTRPLPLQRRTLDTEIFVPLNGWVKMRPYDADASQLSQRVKDDLGWDLGDDPSTPA